MLTYKVGTFSKQHDTVVGSHLGSHRKRLLKPRFSEALIVSTSVLKSLTTSQPVGVNSDSVYERYDMSYMHLPLLLVCDDDEFM